MALPGGDVPCAAVASALKVCPNHVAFVMLCMAGVQDVCCGLPVPQPPCAISSFLLAWLQAFFSRHGYGVPSTADLIVRFAVSKNQATVSQAEVGTQCLCTGSGGHWTLALAEALGSTPSVSPTTRTPRCPRF